MEHETAQAVPVPVLGLGTSGMTGAECRRAVLEAFDLGYRHLDTAQMYDNEDAVGAAIADAELDREEVFLTTKILPENLAYDDLRTTFDESLDRLDTDYVDLLLIHAPSDEVPLAESLEAMNELQRDGWVEHIGVSNFDVDQTARAIDLSETPILTNQVKYHPYHPQDDLLAYCLEQDVLLTAYTPLAKGEVFDDTTLIEIANRHGKTPAQIALRWLVQQDGVITIPQSADPEHLAENIDVFDFALTDAEMAEISKRSE
ncbi:MAG: aldo/keto reductase [Halobacteriales archaeon]